MSENRRAVAIRMLRPTSLDWSREDVEAWLDTLTKPEASSRQAPPPEPIVNTQTTAPPHTEDKAPHRTLSMTALELLERIGRQDHDPLAGWDMSTEALEDLLLQIPLIGHGSSSEDLCLFGDISLASAILSRLPPTYQLDIKLLSSSRPLHSRLDILLRSPRAMDKIESELSKLGDLLPDKRMRDADLAAYMEITESAIRKARSRAKAHSEAQSR